MSKSDVSVLYTPFVAGICVGCCLRRTAKQQAFVLRLAQKTNPALENENWFIIDWVESKWPDL